MKMKALAPTLFAVALQLASCNPVPDHQLSADERKWDMDWMYSMFVQNYAPMDYKQSTLGFDFAKIREQYEKEAIASFDADSAQHTINQEFYKVMYKFVAEFHDAHTSAALTNSSYQGRAQVAYLGFSGYRNGDYFVVKALLPTYSIGSKFPIEVGDHITKINGRSLKDAINTDLVPYRNLGNPESNYTFHMNKLFNRMSTATNGLPKESNVALTVSRYGKEFTVDLPWVVKDYHDFSQEQAAASPKKSTEESFLVSDGNHQFRFNFLGFDGRAQNPLEVFQKITLGLQKTLTDGFQFVDNYSQWNLLPQTIGTPRTNDSEDTESKTSPLERLAEERYVLPHAVQIPQGKTFTTYIAPVKISATATTPEKTTTIAYIYVDTFSPSQDNANQEFKEILLALDGLNIKNIIIDTLNNGGGSLVLGMQMARLLSNSPLDVKLPYAQFKLSDTWHDQFLSSSQAGTGNDSAAVYAASLLANFEEKRAAGAKLTDPYPIEALAPFDLPENTDLSGKFNVVLLVNEMCASMCDIFAGILQDNKLATLVGAQTMGAGGNVVNHQEAPGSHIDLRQTESLMVRSNGALIEGTEWVKTPGRTPFARPPFTVNKGPGDYLENKGVVPDVVIPVNQYAEEKYKTVIEKAVAILSQ